ncbi:MAG: anaerobic ribonucleoside-triphosphate reductase activating protein [Ruminococcaceae bacterium]|nr:anaerobic ribonucleoside-triphosphate reductase activating protein [Oscillospiraceae bacterium]
MKIYGLQKLTLLDYPGLVACTIFTGGCNFRCPFCHNALLVTRLEESKNGVMEEEEVLSFLKKRVGLLDGVCITGGEPLMQKDLTQFIEKVRLLGFKIKLDTNGSYPEKLKELLEKGLLDYVAMDIKNSPDRYAETCGLDIFNVEHIKESVEILKNSGVNHEFRTTVVKEFHDRKSFEDVGKWLSGEDKYYIQNFKDSGNLIKEGLRGFSKDELNEFLSVVKKFIPGAELREVE